MPVIEDTRWRIDPQRSSVEFRVRTLYGLQTIKGRFQQYHGTLDLAAQPSIELTIDAASLTTNNARRDKHLRSADFFDVDNHPQVRFVSERALVDGYRLYVFGDLWAAGRSIRLELDGMIHPVNGELELDMSTFADHRELGMTWNRLGMMRAEQPDHSGAAGGRRPVVRGKRPRAIPGPRSKSPGSDDAPSPAGSECSGCRGPTRPRRTHEHDDVAFHRNRGRGPPGHRRADRTALARDRREGVG